MSNDSFAFINNIIPPYNVEGGIYAHAGIASARTRINNTLIYAHAIKINLLYAKCRS